MAFSTQRAVSDGTMVLLAVSIGYIKQADIAVFYNDFPATPGTWAWVGTTSEIAFTPAIPAGVEVLLKRTTQIDKVINRFTAGAGFTNQSMDTDFSQMLYLNQEAVEGAALTDIFNDVDFHGYRPTNIGLAVNPNDAVSLAQYQADALGAFNYKQTAVAAAAAALASELAAGTYAAAALGSANTAAASEATATAAAGTATAQAGTATAQAGIATAQAVAAAASFDAFDDRYLGAKAVAPTLDNDGNALLTGALYWDTVLGAMRAWGGSAWVTLPTATASSVVSVPAGNLAATNVQDALAELDLEKAKAGANSDITSLGGLTTALYATGQCKLILSGANLLLTPFNGNTITVFGRSCTIPDAGVSLAPTGLLANTLYFIYAVAVGGVVTSIEASTAGHSPDTTATNKGVEIRTDNNSRSMVGWAYCETAATFIDTPARRGVRSWFNDSGVTIKGAAVSLQVATNTFQEVSTAGRAGFILRAGESARASLSANGYTASTNNTAYAGIGLDGGATLAGHNALADIANSFTSMACSASFEPAEGWHFVTPTMRSTGGFNAFVSATVHGHVSK